MTCLGQTSCRMTCLGQTSCRMTCLGHILSGLPLWRVTKSTAVDRLLGDKGSGSRILLKGCFRSLMGTMNTKMILINLLTIRCLHTMDYSNISSGTTRPYLHSTLGNITSLLTVKFILDTSIVFGHATIGFNDIVSVKLPANVRPREQNVPRSINCSYMELL